MGMANWSRRLRFWFEHRRRASLLREEIETHLAMKVAELMEAGMTERDARNEARRRFGNLAHKMEESRAVWIARWMSDLMQDLSFAARTFRKQPGFTAVAVLSSALGIGACATIFGIANVAMFRPLPVEDPSRLLSISKSHVKTGQAGDTMSYPNFLDLRPARSFQAIAGYFPIVAATISSNGEPQRYWGSLVTANYFEVVRPRFALGRGFDTARDDTPGESAAVVLSHYLWQGRFGGDPEIVGKTIEMNKRKVKVVGVTAPGFRGTEVALVSDFWWPLSMLDQVLILTGPKNTIAERDNNWVYGLGRLRGGVSRQEAAAEAEVIGKRLAAQYPASNRDYSLHVETAGQVNAGLRGLVETFFLLLMVVTILVLLTACANVANLLLARASARQKEIATRLAIGAGRGRLLRQLLTESVLLALAGGAAGYLLAFWAASNIGKFQLPFPIPVDLTVTLDHRVVLFSAALAMLTGIVFGLAPAVRATRTDLTGALKDGSPQGGVLRRFGLRNILVVAQVAVCMLLLICSGLFLRSLGASQTANTGMHNRNVLCLAFDPSLNRYTDVQSRQFMTALLARVEALPGVQSATLTTNVPLSLADIGTHIVPEDKMAEPAKNQVNAELYAVAPRFFETLGIPLLAGADFRADQPESEDVAIVNDTLAGKAFPHQSPIGRRVSYEDRMVRIVGVVATAKARSIGEDPRPSFYLPILNGQKENILGVTLLVRAQGDPAAYANSVRQVMRGLDSALPIFDVRTMATHLKNALILPRMGAVMFGLCGAMALSISIVGLYGVVSFAVARRTKEIGIRMALGAARSQVVGMVLRQGLGLAGLGCAIGLAMALAVSRVLAGLLYGIGASDWVTFVFTPLVLIAVALVACLIPARRAAGLNPTKALRCD
jgi:macrolide transport system ATP-binding/permease protein